MSTSVEFLSSWSYTRRRDGTPVQVLVHVEVQAARVTDFARRMFECHTRLMHTYAEPVASFAILADLEPGWRPADYQHALWGCRARFEFPTVKLLDLAPGDPANPFAVVVDAYLRARRTRRDPQARLDAKLTLAKSLYDRGWRRDDVLNLYTFIDWTLRLPLDLAGRFHHDLAKFEEERRMPYVSTAERIGIEKGIEQGIEQGILRGEARMLERLLKLRFGDLPEWVHARLASAPEEDLNRWAEQTLRAADLEDVFG
ncbi:MAG: cytosolic protein [Myxococcales bacterium]|nr:cytosolic protein [Myxococcales bacterium]